MYTKRDYLLVNEGFKITGVHAYKEGLSDNRSTCIQRGTICWLMRDIR